MDDHEDVLENYGLESLKDMCRICANRNNELTSIFEKLGTNINILSKIEEHFPMLKITEDDPLSTCICSRCISLILSWHHLYHTSIDINKKMRQLYDRLNKDFVEGGVYSESMDLFFFADKLNSSVSNADLDYDTQDQTTYESLGPIFIKIEKRDDLEKCVNCDVELVSSEFTTIDNQLYCRPCFSTVQTKFNDENNDLSGNIVTKNGVVNNCTKKQFPCDICDKSFQSKSTLSKHIQKHNKYSCDVCGMSLKNHALLKSHKKRHEKKITKKSEPIVFYCHACQKYFKSKKGLQYHQEKVCMDLKCYLCDIVFLSHDVLQEHNKEKHDTECKISIDVPKITSNENISGTNMCPICGEVITTQISFSHHMKSHDAAKPFICANCGKHFKKKICLKYHLMNEMSLKDFVCDICGMKFINQALLNKHINQHKMETGEFEGWECEICGKAFFEKWRLANHQRSTHKAGKYSHFVCKTCGAEFAERWMVRKHKYEDHDAVEFEQYSCDVCGMEFQENWMMMSHKRRSHKKRSETEKILCELCGKRTHNMDECDHKEALSQVRCQLCDEKFISHHALKEHVNSMHSTDIVDDENIILQTNRRAADEHKMEVDDDTDFNVEENSLSYVCRYCGMEFDNKTRLELHEREKCSKNKINNQCVQCGKVFISKSSLKNHLMGHRKANITSNFSCVNCDQGFFTQEGVNTHLDLQKVCLLCNQVYNCNNQLKNHVMAVHDNDDLSEVVVEKGKLYKCKLCSRTFMRRQAMKDHFYAEMKVRKYNCEFCDKSYNYNSHLLEHIASTHEDKEFVCGYCNKEFPTVKRFRNHMTLHSTDKPFQCHCGASFKLSRYLAKHKKHCKFYSAKLE